MTTESLPRRGLARPVLRIAFTLAWTIGALLAMAIILTVASAASSSAGPERARAALAGSQAREQVEP